MLRTFYWHIYRSALNYSISTLYSYRWFVEYNLKGSGGEEVEIKRSNSGESFCGQMLSIGRDSCLPAWAPFLCNARVRIVLEIRLGVVIGPCALVFGLRAVFTFPNGVGACVSATTVSVCVHTCPTRERQVRTKPNPCVETNLSMKKGCASGTEMIATAWQEYVHRAALVSTFHIPLTTDRHTRPKPMREQPSAFANSSPIIYQQKYIFTYFYLT